VEIGAQLPDGGQELARPHFGDNVGQFPKGGEQVRADFAFAHNRSLTRKEPGRARRYRPITTTGTV
jgi:hypothetical protein